MTKDEIIARILESLQSEAIDEIWARQHITDAFEEGFDAGAQSKEEEIAMLRSAHVISVEQAKTKAVQSLFSRVTPCGLVYSEFEEPSHREMRFTCGRNGRLCPRCEGRAVGREEAFFIKELTDDAEKKGAQSVQSTPAIMVQPSDEYLAKLRFKAKEAGYNAGERKGRLDAAKKEVELLEKILKNDRTPAYTYDEDSVNAYGESPKSGSRWTTPAEMCRDRLRELKKEFGVGE